MELRQEHRKLSLAIVVALDRSGSMTAPVGGGRTKMDLANLGTAEVVDLLGPMDELGVIAVDSAPHQIVALGRVDNKAAIRRRVLSIDSMGGGIYIYEALAAAAGMLADATPQTRHIILFADARDSVEEGPLRHAPEKTPTRQHHRQRDRPGHRHRHVRPAAQGHRHARRGPRLLHPGRRQAPPALRPGHLRRRPVQLHRRTHPRRTHRRPRRHDRPTLHRPAPRRRVQPQLPQARRLARHRHRRRIHRAPPRLLAGGPRPRRDVFGRGRRPLHRPHRRLGRPR